MTTANTRITAIPQADQKVKIITMGDLVKELKSLNGSNTFLSYTAMFDMLEQDNRGQLKKMRKKSADGQPNPFTDGLWKEMKSTATANFDYHRKVERNEGEYSGEGSWMQVVLVNGHLTPLSIHKADIKTNPKKDADPKKDGSYPLAQLEAALDDNGEVIPIVDDPRYYLRYDIVTDQPKGQGNMRCETRYLDKDRNEIGKAEVEPFLKAKSDRKDNTHTMTLCLNNLLRLRINNMTYFVHRSMELSRA